MFLYKKLAIAIVAILVGVPSVSLAGSFTTSLIQGKTPAEAVTVIAEQVDALFGRVQQLEATQTQNTDDIEELRAENARLQEELDLKADIVIPPTETPECLAIKKQIRDTEQQFAVPNTLTNQYDALRQELQSAKQGRIDGLQDTSRTDDNSNDILDWQERLDAANEELDRIEEQIEAVEAQIDGYRAQEQEAKKPLIDKASQSGCLLG